MPGKFEYSLLSDLILLPQQFLCDTLLNIKLSNYIVMLTLHMNVVNIIAPVGLCKVCSCSNVSINRALESRAL